MSATTEARPFDPFLLASLASREQLCLRRLVQETPGAQLEDKEQALAVHYREAPEFEWKLRRIVRQCAVPLAPEYHVLDGKCVVEIKPVAASNGHAIRAFLSEPPFLGRVPVFFGDDVTESDGFSCVEEAGGVSLEVGNDLPAVPHLASLREVHPLLGLFAVDARYTQ